MKFIEIGFAGYKAYSENRIDTIPQSQVMKFAPLMLVFGKNNSGKSVAVRLPRLLLGGLECNDGRVLPINVRNLSYGSNFLDLVHGGDFFGFPSFRLLAEHQGITLDFDVTLFNEGALTAEAPPRIWSYKMRAPKVISIENSKATDGIEAKFTGLLPPESEWDNWRKAAGAVLDGMVHLGPTRDAILPAYANEKFSNFGLRGSEVPHLLRQDQKIANDVGEWYAEHMDGWRLSLIRDSESFSLRMNRGKKLSTNLAQGGEGLQQVLPVVVHQIWRQKNDTGPFLDVIEQPELHLHAAAQAPVADLFINTALQGRGQTLIETNSEPILLRIQRRIAEGKLQPDQVAIYFVEMTEMGSQLRSIAINEDGEVDWWPAGVFEEDFDEVAAIRRAQRARKTQQERS